jgi:4-oxalomesaconate hydratase
MNDRLMVIGAHAADFVWRSAGAIALTTRAGGVARVVALSYGERGESGELWTEPHQTVERVKQIRHREAENAARVLGAEFLGLDMGDYPLDVEGDRLVRITEAIREFAPEVIVTHTDTDPFNPDHGVAHAAVARARSLAAGVGVPSAFPTITPPSLVLFEPHQPEECNFRPNIFVDITPVIDQKLSAMAEMRAQSYLHDHYEQRAKQRAHQARLVSGRDATLEYAEAFEWVTPQVIEKLRSDGGRLRES